MPHPTPRVKRFALGLAAALRVTRLPGWGVQLGRGAAPLLPRLAGPKIERLQGDVAVLLAGRFLGGALLGRPLVVRLVASLRGVGGGGGGGTG